MKQQIAVLFDGNYRIASFDNASNITMLAKENEEWIAVQKIPCSVSGIDDSCALQYVKSAVKQIKDCQVIVGESFSKPFAEYLSGQGFIIRTEQRFSSALLDEISEAMDEEPCAAF